MISQVVSVSGESEPDRKSMRFNGLEALLIQLAVLGVLWPLAFGVGVIGGVPQLKPVVFCLLGLLTAFLLLVSPRLHGDTAGAWGVGSPRAFLRYWRQASRRRRVLLSVLLLPLVSAMVWVNQAYWREIVGFVDLDYPAALALPATWWGRLLINAWGGLLSLFVVTCAIRYDNFSTALRAAMRIALPLCLLIALAAWLHRGPEAFLHADPEALLLQGFGYFFWGMLQQLLFSGYFCTRLRRAFPPGPPATLSRGARLMLCGIGAMAISVLLAAGGITFAEVAGHTLRWSSLPHLTVLLLPLVGAYLWTLTQAPRRLLVASLVASLFASIHLNSLGLVLATFVLGVPLAWVFMEDRKRNLAALSTVHALLGVTLHWLFSSEGAGEFFIDYRVGPWNVDTPGAGTLLMPAVFIAGYAVLAAILAWCPHPTTCGDRQARMRAQNR